MVVDSIGHDELRLTFNELKLSKECLRDFYRSTTWFEAKEAKVIAKERNLIGKAFVQMNLIRSSTT